MTTKLEEVAQSGGRPLPSDEEQLSKAERKQKVRFERPPDGSLFSLQEFHEARSGNYLRELFKAMPEDEILAALPPSRHAVSGKGRRPFPRKAMLRALLVRVALRLPSYAALALRLQQDIVLRYDCGFEFGNGAPGEDCLEDFAQLLGKHTDALKDGLDRVVDELSFLLPGFGESTSWDSAHLPHVKPPQEEAERDDTSAGEGVADGSRGALAEESAAAPPTPPREDSSMASEKESPQEDKDGERETPETPTTQVPGRETPSPKELEPDWGKKTYESVRDKVLELEDGTKVNGLEVKKETLSLFGGKMHLIVDNRYHLPIAIEVTPQSQGDCPMIAPMYQAFCEKHSTIDVHYAMADKAGDSAEVHRILIEELGITPLIPLREMPNREAAAAAEYEFPKTVYDRERVTHMIDPRTGKYEELEPWGYDRSRQAVKYRCPCQRMRNEGRLRADERCPFFGAGCGASQGKFPYSFWVSLKDNWRYYSPVPRESKRWEELYKQRTTVERVNGLAKGPLQLGEKRLRSLVTGAAEAHLACLVLCARAKVAIDWGAPEKVGSAVSQIPYRRHRMAV